MKRQHLILFLITGLVMTGVTMAIAKPAGFMSPHRDPGNNPLAQLDLDTEQTRKIRQLRLSLEESIMPLKLREHRVSGELNILWLQMTPDTGKIKSLQKDIHDIRFQILEKETDFRIAVREVLTEDQVYRFLALGGDRCHGPDKFGFGPPQGRPGRQ